MNPTLPAGWTRTYLSEVLETMENGSRPKGGIQEMNDGIPSLGGEHLDSEGGFNFENIRLVSKEFYEEMKRGKIRSHDVLLVKDGATTGKVSIIDDHFPYKNAAVNEHLFILRGKRKLIDQEFLFYHLLSSIGQQQIRASFHGAAIGGINTQFVKNYSVLLPPIPIQKQIVSILKAASRATRLRREADNLTKDLLKAVFVEMFGNVITNDKGWQMMRFSDIANSRLGKMLDSKKQTGQKRKKYLRNTNVQWGHFDLEEVAEMDFDESERVEFRLKNGDLLICEGGEIGRCAIWNDELPECYFQKALHRVRVNTDKVLPHYLLYVFWYFSERNGFNKIVHSVTITHLTGVMLKELIFPIPPISLQRKFVDIVTTIERIKSSQVESHTRIQNLRSVVTQKAFNGELLC